MLDFIAFSRNRPIQLHALLSSMKEKVEGSHRITVIQRNDPEYLEASSEVQRLFPNVRFIDETSFREQVIDAISESGNSVAFLVDDIIFKERIDLNVPVAVLSQLPEVLCFSLRLGLHLDYCFPVDGSMRIPDGNVNNGVFFWDWTKSEFDWNYPLSLDGHIFRKEQILQLTNAIQFRNPNEFEAVLQFLLKSFQLPNICSSFVRSTLLNVPMNRVQDEFRNRCLDISVEQLHDAWKSGKEIDRTRLEGYINHGAHEPLTLSFRTRE